MSKTIITVFFFESDSSPGTEYQTLEYSTGETSCDCKGWTRRLDSLGNRSCKHTRIVESGAGELKSKRFHFANQPPKEKATTSTKTNRKQTSAPSVLDQGARQFSFET